MNYLQQQNPQFPVLKEKLDYGNALVVRSFSNTMHVESTKYSNNGILSKDYSIFAYGTILGVERRQYAAPFCKRFDYIFKIIPYGEKDEVSVVIPDKMYGKSGMITELTKAGICFVGNHGDGKRASMIINYISSMGMINDTPIVYYNGFYDDKYLFFKDNEPLSDIDSPLYNNRLLVGKDNISPEQAVRSVYELNEIFSVDTWLMLLVILLYSLMHTIFSDKGYVLCRLIWLCGKDAETAAKFIQIYNKDTDMTISLNNNISSLRRQIFDCKDMPVIFKGDNEKISFLEDIFCNGDCPEINVNKQLFRLKVQSVCILISNIADEILSPNCYYTIFSDNVSDECNIDINAFGSFIVCLINKFMGKLYDGTFDYMLKKHQNTANDLLYSKSDRTDMTIFLTTYEIIQELFAEYGLPLSKLLNGESPDEFFADFIEGEEIRGERNIVNKTRLVIIDKVLSCENIIKYDGRQLETEILPDKLLVLYNDKYLYIYGEQFDKLIVPYVSASVTKNQILETLADSEWIYRSGNGYSVRISVMIKGNRSKRSNWIAVKRSFVESRFSLPIIEEKNMICKKIKPVLLGNEILGRNVYLPIGSDVINNNHIGITGDSGMGKSYATLSIIKHISDNNIPSVIIDTEDSFNKNTLEKDFVSVMGDKLQYFTVYNEKIPINIFERQIIDVNGEMCKEKDSDIAARCSYLLRRACKLSEKQMNVVYMAIKSLLEKNSDTDITLMDLYEELEYDESESSEIARGRILPIADADVFREDGTVFNWRKHLESGKCVLFSLAGFKNNNLKRMIAECILQDLWGFAKSHGRKDKPFAVIIDEIEATRPKQNSTMANLLTLGRKFGVMCIWNTQLLKGKFEDDEIAALNQTATRLYFKTSDLDEKNYIEKTLKKYEGISESFEKLKKTLCFAKGSFCSEDNVIYEDILLVLKIQKIQQ
ncbi:MAG: ATP-binding protein [Oscillospiraceae bacterium]|nr:ATP-binding protein [Oscillospiraceae bacterium]